MIKRLFEKLKALRLYFVVSNYKDNDEYIQYGMCPGFTVWTNGSGCVDGHMVIKKSDTKEEISYKLIELITKLCRENNIGIEQTVIAINDNLKSNGLL